MLEIQEVIKKANQGYCTPYLCRGMDGKQYYVKAANEGILQRRDLIHEWLCGHLGRALSLPIPEFFLCDISDELFNILPRHLKGIGKGIGFASRVVDEVIWLESHHMIGIPCALKRDVLLFDYWIMNMDRTAHNTNMLLATKDLKEGRGLRVIDHNLAFDTEFNEAIYFSEPNGHIFASQKVNMFNDLALRSELTMRMDLALESYQKAIDELPEEWAWRDIEQTMPIDVDYSALWVILTRYQQDNFWSMK